MFVKMEFKFPEGEFKFASKLYSTFVDAALRDDSIDVSSSLEYHSFDLEYYFGVSQIIDLKKNSPSNFPFIF